MGGLLHLVQRGGAWAGCGPAQSLLAVPNVAAQPPTASAITSYHSMWHCNCLWTPKAQRIEATQWEACICKLVIGSNDASASVCCNHPRRRSHIRRLADPCIDRRIGVNVGGQCRSVTVPCGQRVYTIARGAHKARGHVDGASDDETGAFYVPAWSQCGAVGRTRSVIDFQRPYVRRITAAPCCELRNSTSNNNNDDISDLNDNRH